MQISSATAVDTSLSLENFYTNMKQKTIFAHKCFLCLIPCRNFWEAEWEGKTSNDMLVFEYMWFVFPFSLVCENLILMFLCLSWLNIGKTFLWHILWPCRVGTVMACYCACHPMDVFDAESLLSGSWVTWGVLDSQLAFTRALDYSDLHWFVL